MAAATPMGLLRRLWHFRIGQRPATRTRTRKSFPGRQAIGISSTSTVLRLARAAPGPNGAVLGDAAGRCDRIVAREFAKHLVGFA
jgi:hypothetical protein